MHQSNSPSTSLANKIPWSITLDFFFAKGFITTGLGKRIAYGFVRLFGKSFLGLTYSLFNSGPIQPYEGWGPRVPKDYKFFGV